MILNITLQGDKNEIKEVLNQLSSMNNSIIIKPKKQNVIKNLFKRNKKIYSKKDLAYNENDEGGITDEELNNLVYTIDIKIENQNIEEKSNTDIVFQNELDMKPLNEIKETQKKEKIKAIIDEFCIQ